jgi:hypothetical protein
MGYVMPNIGGSAQKVLENLMKVRKETKITGIARKENSYDRQRETNRRNDSRRGKSRRKMA